MADSIITKQELIDAQKDAVTLKDAVNGNETGIVTPRLNDPYPTLPAAIQKIESDGAAAVAKLENTGGFISAPTLTALQAITPEYDYQLARVDDTGNEYRWNPALMTTVKWEPTGRNFLSESKAYTDLQLQKKQNTVNADTLTVIDFSAYLKVGNIGTTGLLENTNFANRRSIVNYPVDPAKFYLIRNTADLLSNLRVAWFDSSNSLLSIVTKTAGQMADLLLTPVANAAFVSIGLKSGNTDNVKYDETKVAFYSSTSADLGISKINAWDLRDSRVPAIQQKLSDIDKIVFGYKKVNTWLQYGIGSTGQLNTYDTESHTDYIAVTEGGLITSDLAMYRVNLYTASQVFISQGGFTGGNSFTIPEGLNVAYVRVTCQKNYATNATVLTVYNKLNSIELLNTLVEKNKTDIASKQSYIKPDSVTVIDFSAYLQNGNIGTTGELEANTRRRSIVKMPVQQNITYLIKNNSDLLSNLRVAWFDANSALLSIQYLAPAVMSNWQFTAPASAAFVSITLKSGNTDGQIYDASKVVFYSSTNTKFTIEQINGFDLAGSASEALQTRIQSLETNAVMNVSVGGTFALKNGNIVTIDAASAQKSGLMSAADKAKLDALINGNITINGSGVTKNAAAYGFLPTNNATQNVTAMKAAVAGGGLILVDYPGVYDVNETIPLESNTAIVFGPKVYINKVSFNGKSPRYTFINKGAYTREWNENIILKGLKIKCNGIGNGGDGTQSIAGLRGHVAMFYVRNLLIDDFELLDGDAQSYVIHVCTFENIMITRPRIEGYKDAIHLGNGKTFVIRDGQFKTYDDPIALNAHDYATGQPELGWVENGLIENCYDLDDPVRGTTGYFARILAGAWVDWFSGMQVQQSDTVVASNGKMYRVSNGVTDPVTYYTSTTEPSHASGNATLDGIVWTMAQENGVTHTVGVRNVKFKDIFLQKKRDVALSIHFDNGRFSRSYYPNAPIPVQENIVFESMHMQAEIPVLLSAVTPVKNIKVLNSEINKTKFNFTHLTTTGLVYNPVNILMIGNTFTSTESNELVTCTLNRAAKVKILGSIKENDSYNPTVSSNVTIISSDL